MPEIITNPNIGSAPFLIGQNDPNLSNEIVILAATTIVLPAGSVIGKKTIGALTATAGAVVGPGTPGNGVVSAITVDVGEPAGDWEIQFTEDGATAAFEVRRPDGSLDGVGAVGTAYDGGINFTISDGANDYLEDQIIPVAVSMAAGAGTYGPYDPDATDGRAVAAAILYHDAPISTGTQKNVGVFRHQVVNGNLLKWGAGVDANEKALAEAQLAQAALIVRY